MLVYALLAAVAFAMPLIEVHQSESALLPKLETKRQFTIRTNPPLERRANRLISVVVGGPQDTFVPNLIRAAVGDVIQFQFSSGNHTVTQSAEDAPCQPLQATVAGAIHSGHIPFESGQTTVGTFNLPLTSTDPIYLYCATGPHCQNGQVMAINPPNEASLVNYSKLSAAAAANVDGTEVSGGTVGEIPLDGAAFTPAEEEEGPPPAPPVEATPSATPA
ncbi:hypothetical protein BHE90_010602 [Fusarium euwallaceae]|uniref:Extracellular serine-rich protein n=4 Tax=Fusarium solani species complex TaxID=232080 RepID=A0A3M2RHV1_9HYPO|nr:hypothetical protein CDV36_014511 [Fusarium kuroshium]RSL80137.1 hypothetical protein CEP51_006812 [Fusarium floridanum]RSM12820.1 hypothetical protein CDV31_006168 [Fusarium ambrosium]RTE74968.1 hypothetical protein BHE90_010602 [Fusarium euwallaceae]